MTFDPERHHRRSIRLACHDYSQVGGYFVTLCTAGRECLFGTVVAGEVSLNPVGLLVARAWEDLPRHFPLELDAFVVMPNHLHGILHLGESPGGSRRHSLSEIIRAFKGYSTKRVHFGRRPGGLVWQRNYHERVIRDEAELQGMRRYVVENPIRWEVDRENPAAQGTGDEAGLG